jgi:DNA polymerase-3 subunit epsilon
MEGLSMVRPASAIGTAAVLDIETTGFSPLRDEIVELAMTLFRYDRATGHLLEIGKEYSSLREPSCSIPRSASQVHGITRRAVQGLRFDYRPIRAMLRQSDFVVAHYAAFDRGFVERLMPSFRSATWLCSRDDIDWWAKGFESRSLEDLAAAHEIENRSPHRASGDAATLLALLAHKPRRKAPYLYELLRNAGLIVKAPQPKRLR